MRLSRNSFKIPEITYAKNPHIGGALNREDEAPLKSRLFWSKSNDMNIHPEGICWVSTLEVSPSFREPFSLKISFLVDARPRWEEPNLNLSLLSLKADD